MIAEDRLNVRAEGNVLHVQLHRPDVHNALDGALVEELRATFTAVSAPVSKRWGGISALVLSGVGRSFCAGADLGWMRTVASYGPDENRRDALALARMLRALDSCAVPTIARVQGAALGGGMGLLACCDVVVAAEDTHFGFTEARLGLLPAIISPFVVAKIGPGQARALFITGERFDAVEALRLGLVHRIVSLEELDSAVDHAINDVLAGGPAAVTLARELVRRVAGREAVEVEEYTADLLVQMRAGEEGREGMAAFLEKRRPRWASQPRKGSV